MEIACLLSSANTFFLFNSIFSAFPSSLCFPPLDDPDEPCDDLENPFLNLYPWSVTLLGACWNSSPRDNIKISKKKKHVIEKLSTE